MGDKGYFSKICYVGSFQGCVWASKSLELLQVTKSLSLLGK